MAENIDWVCFSLHLKGMRQLRGMCWVCEVPDQGLSQMTPLGFRSGSVADPNK